MAKKVAATSKKSAPKKAAPAKKKKLTGKELDDIKGGLMSGPMVQCDECKSDAWNTGP